MKRNSIKKINILIVDDSREILELFKFIFKKYNLRSTEDAEKPHIFHFCLSETNTAEKALQIVEENFNRNTYFHLAFIDINLGFGKNGIWAAEKIRKIDKNIEFVFFSGLDSINFLELQKRVKPVNKIIFLQKPLSYNEIINICQNLALKYETEKELRRINKKLKTELSQKSAQLTDYSKKVSVNTEKLKKAKSKIEAMEFQYETIFNEINDLIIVTDNHKRIIDVNRHFVKELGYNKEEVVDKCLGKFLKNKINFKSQSELIENENETKNFTFLSRSGEEKILEVKLTSLINNERKMLFYVCRNVTNRIKNEIKARRRSLVIKNMDEAVLISDMHGTIMDVNKAFERIYGFKREEIIHKTMDRVNPA